LSSHFASGAEPTTSGANVNTSGAKSTTSRAKRGVSGAKPPTSGRRTRGTRGMPRAARERLILDVAGQVFARGGYHAASMDEIAELAGVSKPMLYAYFGSKEGLYVAYIDVTGKELLERLTRAGSGDDTPVELLRKRISEFLSFVEDYRDGWKVLFSEVIASRPLEDEVARLRRQIAEEVRRWVEGAMSPRSGSLGAASDAIAHAIVGAGESLANWWLEHPDTPRAQVTDWYVGIVQGAVPAALGGAPGRPGDPRAR
jgi:AcrR family transcriptional regulator